MGLRLVLLLMLTLLLVPSMARAQCVNPAGNQAEIIHNSTHNVPQYCDGTNWIAMVGQAPEPTGPQNCSSIGETCDDGSIYAGLSPDGGVAMYTTPADAPSTYSWNDGTTNYTNLSMADCNDVSPGTAATCQTGEANTVFLVGATGEPDYPFTAAAYCDGLTAHGYSDWYLPAMDELNVLYTNKNTGALNGTFNETGSVPAGYYWSSSEVSNFYARDQRFSNGSQLSLTNKNDALAVRCVRRHEAGEGISQQTEVVPNGLIGHWRFDETSGTTAADSSGNGNGATMQNALDASSDSVAGKMGNALRFNYPTDANEWAETADVATFGGLTAMSYSMWVKLDRLDGHKGLFEIPGVALARLNWDTGNLRFRADGWSVSNGQWYPSYGPLDAVVDEWQHIVVTYGHLDF